MITRRELIHSTALLSLGAMQAYAQSPVLGQLGKWQAAAALPIQTQELYPTAHKGRVYVAGGIAAKLGVPYFSKACFAYHPADDHWYDTADLPEARHHAALISTGDHLYMVRGFHGSYTSIWQMRDTVHVLGESGWVPTTSLPQPQAEGVLASHRSGVIHLVSGQSPKGDANSQRSDHQEVGAHWRWLGEHSRWESAAPIPTPRNSASGGWFNDQLIVCGGRTARGNLNATEIYDAQEDRWRTAAPMPTPQAGHASAIIPDGLMVFGGEIFSPQAKVFDDVWVYRISTDSWHRQAPLPTPRHGLGAVRINNRIYVVGGATAPGGSGTSNLNEVLVLT